VTIRAITEGPDWSAAFAVMRELRPHLDEATFTARCREARARDGYTLWGAFDGGDLLAVLGVRLLVDLLHGPHLYVDDLVVTASARSRGLGPLLLAHAEALAREAGGLGLRLRTGIDYLPARRFYEREGWQARAVVYKKGFPA
jgi:GNAT superfamily N-acetyltransferase